MAYYGDEETMMTPPNFGPTKKGGVHFIENARSDRGAYVVAVSRLLVALAFLAMGFIFLAFSICNILNTRVDINTDFVGRDCALDDDDVCQERDLRRVHGKDINWFYSAVCLAIGFAYFLTLAVIWSFHFGATHSDMRVEDIDKRGNSYWFETLVTKALGSRSGIDGARDYPLISWWRSFEYSIELVEMERLNGFTINHNVVHLAFDSFFWPILLSSLGVRDTYKLVFFGLLTFGSNLFLWYGQVSNRVPWNFGRDRNITVEMVKVRKNGMDWRGVIMYTIFTSFVWCMFMVYAFKFPHKARTWYMITNMIIVLCYMPLHVLYQLAYYDQHDSRIGARAQKMPRYAIPEARTTK